MVWGLMRWFHWDRRYENWGLNSQWNRSQWFTVDKTPVNSLGMTRIALYGIAYDGIRLCLNKRRVFRIRHLGPILKLSLRSQGIVSESNLTVESVSMESKCIKSIALCQSKSRSSQFLLFFSAFLTSARVSSPCSILFFVLLTFPQGPLPY